MLQVAEYGDDLSVPMDVPSTLKATEATPALAEAFACIVTEPETVEPFEGLVIATVGGDVTGGVVVLFTVTVTLALAVLPVESVTTALTVCEPFVAVVVFQVVEQADVVIVVIGVPSTLISKDATPAAAVAFA